MRTSSRSAAALLAGGLVASLALSAAPASASDPEKSTLKGPKSGSATVSWTGEIADPGTPVTVPEDNHSLTLAAPVKGRKAAAYFSKNTVTLDVVINWTGPYNDLDLRVLDPNGTQIAIDGAAPGVESESVSVPVGMPGTYTVEVSNFLGEPGVTYDAVATLSVG